MKNLLNSLKKREFKDKFSGNLVIFCSDERFVKATIDFLKEDLGIDTSDLVVVAGGPAFIPRKEIPLLERLELLIKAHQIKKIILISHEKCGYYKFSYPKLDFQALKNLQLEDLKKALAFLKEKEVEVRAFFAFLQENQIIFKEIYEGEES